jgi:hypothetical protein
MVGTDTCNFNLTRLNEVDYSLTNVDQKHGLKRGGISNTRGGMFDGETDDAIFARIVRVTVLPAIFEWRRWIR